MPSERLQLIEQAIIAIKQKKERLPPRNVKNDLIGDYDDFLREQPYLRSHYNFNVSVFNSLVTLADELWSGTKRFNRYNLMTTMKQYLVRGNYKLDHATRVNLFELFRKILADGKASASLSEICFSMLRNFSLSAEYETWLCEQTKLYKSETLLRLILNYPVASAVITEWVTDNFHRDEIRMHRYKAIAWLLNTEPDYNIDNQTLVDDFEFANRQDAGMILNAYYEHDEPLTFVDTRSYKNYPIEADVRFHLISRSYCSVVCRDIKAYEMPDFTPLRTFFTENLTEIKNQTMLWAVAISKLPTNTKVKLLKKHYSPACFWTLLNISKRYKILTTLEWMKKQAFAESIFCEIELDRKLRPEIAEDKLNQWKMENPDLKHFVEKLGLEIEPF